MDLKIQGLVFALYNDDSKGGQFILGEGEDDWCRARWRQKIGDSAAQSTRIIVGKENDGTK